jgi:hypothetical protein
MVVNIFGEVEHDCQPDIVRGDFDVSVLDVGLVEGIQKSILVWVAEMAVLLIIVDPSLFLPKDPSVFAAFLIKLSLLKFLYGYGFEVFVDNSCLNLKLRRLSSFSFFQGFEHLSKKILFFLLLLIPFQIDEILLHPQNKQIFIKSDSLIFVLYQKSISLAR